tara:strand:+ start:5227 stop:6711 length:1485 start_codon:yes stop_codon:yes gene_type:complete
MSTSALHLLGSFALLANAAVSQSQSWTEVAGPGIHTFAVSRDYATDGRVWYVPKTLGFYGDPEVRGSTDHGDSFPFVGSLPVLANVQNIQAFAASPNFAADSVLFASSVENLVGSHVWKSVDGGVTWSMLANPPGQSWPNRILTLVLSSDYAQDQTVLLSALGVGGASWRSTNGGTSWVAIFGPRFVDLELAQDFAGSGFVYGLQSAGTGSFYRSDNSGQSFTSCLGYGGLPCAFVGNHYGIAVPPAGPGSQRALFYYGEAQPQLGSNNNFLRSLNNGQSWFPAGSGLAGLIVFDAVVAPDYLTSGRIYVATDGGVFVSDDGATTFQPLAAPGLPNPVTKLALAGGSSGDLYAKTGLASAPGGGFYRLRLVGTGAVDLGNELAGAAGAPGLAIETAFGATTAFVLRVDGGAPSTGGLHAFGFGLALTPFAGGVLVPSADILVAFATDAAGAAQLPLAWPSFLPPGFRVWTQSWLADPSGPQQLTATSGWQVTRL